MAGKRPFEYVASGQAAWEAGDLGHAEADLCRGLEAYRKALGQILLSKLEVRPSPASRNLFPRSNALLYWRNTVFTTMRDRRSSEGLRPRRTGRPR